VARILLFTGKGGVGKTSVAAATALKAAERGLRTIVLSTDPAHSLADVFDRPVGAEPVALAERLTGQEIDVYYSLQKHWHTLQSYLLSLFRWRGVSEVFAEEMSVLPGMEEVAGFLWVYEHFASGDYDLIVIDAAPTGETLRFLSLPDVGRWWMEKLFPIQRRLARVVGPAVKAVSDIPIPKDETYDAAAQLFRQLDSIHDTFTDPEITSVRVVVNPETVVIRESQRTFTYLHLFGYAVDAIILNRVLPPDVEGSYFDALRAAQQRNRALIEDAFAPLPILEAPFFPREVLGLDRIRLLADRIYGERIPADRLSDDRVFEVETPGDGRVGLVLSLPFVRKSEVELVQSGTELAITVGNFRRNLHLPRVFRGRDVERAKIEDGRLRVVFGLRASERSRV